MLQYSESQILQMAGRAGRPQFCKEATVVILTSQDRQHYYQGLMEGRQMVESSLHRHLYEHINAEIILGTVASVQQAIVWLQSTYLFIRMKRNPGHYELGGAEPQSLEEKVGQLCGDALQEMQEVGLVSLGPDGAVVGTSTGRLMSRFYLAYDTMKQLTGCGTAGQAAMLETICRAREMQDAVLRTSEKKTLNGLNRNKERKNIRYQIAGKIKTKEQKVNVLIQASLGCMNIADAGLAMEAPRYLRLASRVATCLFELIVNHPEKGSDLLLVRDSLQLLKSLECGLWEDSQLVARQMSGVGAALSASLARAGFTSLSRLAAANPRMLEIAAKKAAPWGNLVRDWAGRLPRYSLQFGSPTRHHKTIQV